MVQPISYQRITIADGQDSFLFRVTTSCGTFLRWRLQDLPGFWITLFHICPVLRPRPDSSLRPPSTRKSTAPTITTMKAPALYHLSRLNHTASVVAVYASSLRSPYMRKTRFRLLVRLCRVGFAPTGLLRKFQRSLILSQFTSLYLAPRLSVCICGSFPKLNSYISSYHGRTKNAGNIYL